MLSPGEKLGRYEVVSPLGAGGMGEVYRARDTELRREVALKILPEALSSDPDRLKRFEREARATAALSHPNVLTVFDVGRQDGRTYLVFEMLEGSTLAEMMKDGAPRPREALDYAGQVARGLAAAHARGIVHRDLKPANLFLATTGVVKILDFGLARIGVTTFQPPEGTTAEITRPGVALGTISYMSPEQVKGLAVDGRSDLFSLGVVLYEMLSGRHPFRRTSSAETVSAILRDEPPELGALEGKVPVAVERLARRCLEKRPEDRFQTANDLALALDLLAQGEDAGTRPRSGSGPEARFGATGDERPYPGLSSFTEADAGRFFGREPEIAALWEKLRRQSLLAVIGPSGVGKTSFLRAGVVAQRPAGWAAVYMTPGAGPVGALARALTASLTTDPDAMADLVQGAMDPDAAAGDERLLSAVSRWRQKVDATLLIVDQFEELFTLNPKETQDRFASLLGRLANEADVHVLLSLRDDFLFRCAERPALTPVFHDLTPLTPPSPESLRRALVEPAARLGVRFEDEALAAEMVAAVEKERGALPLLAFAISRLWGRREREKKLLTREAYHALGGVAGALAQHAEATLERIGREREGLVREIFRNLTTADGTRADLDREDLLSRFPERAAAERALGELVDARLVTSYEALLTDSAAARAATAHRERVEIVHESLLHAWPRLVRWRTQDEGGAQLREQLLQAARLWEERGRAVDLLWTGPSFREFALWRERHPKSLSPVEEAYAKAMTARAIRQRRRRRMAAIGMVVAAVAIAAVMSVLWARSERARAAALAELGQREAAQILSLGRLRLEDHPSATLAHAIASLERADNTPARLLAMEALWKGPPEIVVDMEANVISSCWSADGRWLALGSMTGMTLLDRDTGRRHRLGKSGEHPVGFSADGTRLVSRSQAVASELHLWSLPEALLLETWPPAERLAAFLIDRRLLTFRADDTNPPPERAATVEERSIDGGLEKALGRFRPRGLSQFAVDPAGERLFSLQGGRLLEQRLDALDTPPRVLGRHDGASWIAEPRNGRLLTADTKGELRMWDAATGRVDRALRKPAETPSDTAVLDPRGRFVAASLLPGAVLFDLQAPRSADPVRLMRKEGAYRGMSFHPQGGWLAYGTSLWNLAARRATVLRGQKGQGIGVAFTHDGRLVSTSNEGVVRLWTLDPSGGDPIRELWAEPRAGVGPFLALDAKDRFAVFSKGFGGQVYVQPLDLNRSRARQFKVQGRRPTAADPQLDPAGERVAFASLEFGNPEASSIRLLDLRSGDERVLRTQDTAGACAKPLARVGPLDVPAWLPDGRLVSDGLTGLRLWDLATGSSRQLRPCRPSWNEGWAAPNVRATPDGRALVALLNAGDKAGSDLSVADLTTGVSRGITSHGTRLRSFALDPTGKLLVTGDADGLVRAGSFTGEEPHLLYGHTQAVTSVAVSRDGKWIASGSDDDTIRLWPIPEGAPLHALPLEELLAKLRSLTNLRVVPDPAAATGYKVEPGPFPGWAKAPTW